MSMIFFSSAAAKKLFDIHSTNQQIQLEYWGIFFGAEFDYYGLNSGPTGIKIAGRSCLEHLSPHLYTRRTKMSEVQPNQV
jgi:hypothetical protein